MKNRKPPIESKIIKYYWIFTVKFDLSIKTRLVVGGHMNKKVPLYTPFSSVVSREIVRLSFLLATIHGLDLFMGDIINTYLQAEYRK